MDKLLHRLTLNRETIRRLSDEDLSRAAGAFPPPIQRYYSIRDEYTCQCDTNPFHGCEWYTVSCGGMCG